MRRKLDLAEKLHIQQERLRLEESGFPEMNIAVFVDDYTYANGEPQVRVVSMPKPKSEGPVLGPARVPR